MPVQTEILQDNINHTLIETGTFKGVRSKIASTLGFSKVITIELQKKLHLEAKENLKEEIESGIVEALLGDSSEVLINVLKTIDKQSTILLDAHIDGGNYVQGETPEIRKCPLYEELNIIKNHQIKTHTILIDDVRILGNVGWGLEVNVQKIKDLIKEINSDYIITQIEDVLIAKIIK